MSLPVITGIAPRWESAIATILDASAHAHLVRRCADVGELVGVAHAGLARVALVSSDLRGLDREVLTALIDAGVQVVGVQPPGDDDGGRMLRRWGVRSMVGADVAAHDLDLVLVSCADPTGTGGHGQQAGHPPGGVATSTFRREEQRGGRQGSGPRSGDTNDTRRDETSGPQARGDDTPDKDPNDVGKRAEQAGHDEDPSPGGGDPSEGGQDGPIEISRIDELVEDRDLHVEPPSTRTHEQRQEDGAQEPGSPEPGMRSPPARGQVLVVWGPAGSTGRTTVAVNLAAELATPLEPVILVDADTYAASVAQFLAVLDEAPGVAAAARAADQDTLDADGLQRLAPEVRPGLSVLTGLPRADRWPELRDASLADLLEVCTQVARWVVVDVAPVAEQDEELSFDTRAPRRNGATLTALEAADRIVVVGAGDPVGLHRLIRCLDALPGLSTAPRDVVVTRVRPGPVGPEPQRRITESLTRFAGISSVHLLPEDRESLDAALLHGRLLLEVRPASALRLAIQQVAAVVRGDQVRARRSRPSWRSRLRRGR